MKAVLSSVSDLFLKFLDWLDEKTGGRFHEIIEGVKNVLSAAFDFFIETATEVIDSAKQVFKGLTEFLMGIFTGDFSRAWTGLKNVLKGAINGMIALLNGLIRSAVAGLNALMRVFSFSVNLPFGGSIGFSMPQFTAPQIPMLAKGAVIPPNAPFLAMLGDQRHGTNIEAPEDLLRKIIREEAGEITLNESFDLSVDLDGLTVARKLYKYNKQVKAEHGVNLITSAGGV